MTAAYRLHSSRYPASSGQGAAILGGRWNPKGVPVVYTASSPSLAALEILVHYSVLPRDFALTPVYIPDSVRIANVPETVLIDGWDQPIPAYETQEYGRQWWSSGSSAVLRVHSAVIGIESNYVINVLHTDYSQIQFSPSEPFRFDPRMK